MADTPQLDNSAFEQKSFWKRPEGFTGMIFLIAFLVGAGYLLYRVLPALTMIFENLLYLTGLLLVLFAIGYIILDPRMRTLVWYMYKSAMRKITSWFVTIDPIGILKNYVDDLEKNLRKMSKQIGEVKGQIRKLQTIISDNEKEIENNLALAHRARDQEMNKEFVLASRRAGRLQDSNVRYNELLQKLEVLYRVLTKMYQNSEILLEDTKDQVKVKEEERKAIRASHSAMRSAMNVIKGDTDKRIMFDQALDAIADDVASKVGEMEHFMEMSSTLMNSIDLQQGVFEDKGMELLEQWEKESELMLLASGKRSDTLNLDFEVGGGAEKVKQKRDKGASSSSDSYDNLFD